MKKTCFLLCLALLCVSLQSFSQQTIVPASYELKAKDDYARYEKDVINAATWLETAAFNKTTDESQKVGAFIVAWVNGSPTVNVELNEYLLDLEKKNKGMLILYMAECAKYVLQNNYSKDMRAKHRFAVTALATAYKAGNGIKKDKKMEKLVKPIEENKLDEWLDEKLKIQQ